MLDLQRSYCASMGVDFRPSFGNARVGVSLNVRDGVVPLNGLRHPESPGVSGWYLWAGGEPSQDSEFFRPIHALHLPDWCPAIVKFLGLPPGWRFLVAGEYEDVWFDSSLLKVQG